MQKNKPYTFITEEGEPKTLYDGRYACILAIVIAKEDTATYVLANKRGPGCPNEVGKWNMPCGYMDAGSAPENCSKEVFEETGIKINPDRFALTGIGDSERNVTLRYKVKLFKRIRPATIEELKNLGGEENEVEEIQWINLDHIEQYDWAFNHYELLRGLRNYENLLREI